MSYPSNDLVDEWYVEANSADYVGTVEQFMARKACDWQREQDALVCDEIAAKHLAFGGHEYGDDIGPALEECAEAIRKQ
jgi:hypothetical protein